MFQNVSGFNIQKVQWIPRANECDINFFGAFVVSPIPQQANIAMF